MLTPSNDHIAVEPVDYMALGTGVPRGHATRIMSRSELKRFAYCPARWLRGGRDDETTSTEWGSLIDCLFLTQSEFRRRYAITPETYLADGKKKGDPQESKPWNRNATVCKEWEREQESSGLICIKPGEETEARAALREIEANQKFMDLTANAKTQVALVVDYHDSTTGLVVPVKVCIDIVPDAGGSFGQYLADFKTTKNAHPSAWPREVHAHWYHVQAALYIDAWNAQGRRQRCSFVHLKQENFPPYQTATCQLSQEFIEDGRALYRRALAEYCQCLESGIWPDYDTERPGVWQADGFPICEPEPWMALSQH